MAKKKNKTLKYIAFGLICGGLYIFFRLNGLDLIELYPVQIGGLATLFVTKLAAKWFGWNLSSLFNDEINKKAGEAVITAAKKGSRKIAVSGKKFKNWAKAKLAAKKLQEDTGCGKLKALIVTQEVYRKMKRENPEIFAKEAK